MTFDQLIPAAVALAAAALAGPGLAVLDYDATDHDDLLRDALFDKGLCVSVAHTDTELHADSRALGADLTLRQYITLSILETRSRNATGLTPRSVAVLLLKAFTQGAPGAPSPWRPADQSPIDPGPREDPEFRLYFLNLQTVTKN